MKIRTPTTRQIREKAMERKGRKVRKVRKENRDSSIPMVETGNKGYPSYDSGKGKGGQQTKSHIAPTTQATYAGWWTDQDWDPSWNWSESGWYSFHETSSTGRALLGCSSMGKKPSARG